MNKLIILIISISFISCFSGKEKEKKKENLVKYPTTYNLIIKNEGSLDIDLSCLNTNNYCASKFIDYVDNVNEFSTNNKDQFVKLTLLNATDDSIRYTIELFEIRSSKDTIRVTNGGTFKRRNNCEDIAKTLCIMINK